MQVKCLPVIQAVFGPRSRQPRSSSLDFLTPRSTPQLLKSDPPFPKPQSPGPSCRAGNPKSSKSLLGTYFSVSTHFPFSCRSLSLQLQAFATSPAKQRAFGKHLHECTMERRRCGQLSTRKGTLCSGGPAQWATASSWCAEVTGLIARSGLVQETTNKCTNKWNNTAVSLKSINRKKMFQKPKRDALKTLMGVRPSSSPWWQV